MAIAASDLVKRGSASMPKADTGTSGGAIDATMQLDDMPMGSASAPKIKSSNSGDTTQTVTLYGRNAAGAIVSEVQTLNGLTLVSYTTSFVQILRVVKSASTTGSVGVYMNDGTTLIVSLLPATIENLCMFYDSASDPSSEKKRYEKEHWKNGHGTLTLNAALVRITADPASKIKIGLEDSDNQTTTNRLTAPSSVAFVDDAVDIDITSLAAGADVGIWVEQTLAAGASAYTNTYTTRLSGTTAA